MIIPYLTFQGDCEEAIRLYTSVLGGRIEHLSRYTSETGSFALVGKVMHSQASFGSGAICAADQEGPVQHSDAVSLLVHCATSTEANRILDAFAVDGVLLQRLTPHPPPDDGGMGALVRDKYGYTWILTAPNDRK